MSPVVRKANHSLFRFVEVELTYKNVIALINASTATGTFTQHCYYGLGGLPVLGLPVIW
jgi:hypothetical protein